MGRPKKKVAPVEKRPIGRPKADEHSKLTARQKKFCEFYLVNGKAVESMRKAGYSETSAQKTGYRMLQIPAIKAYLAKISKKARSDRILDIKQRKEKLSLIVAAAFEETGDVIQENAGNAIKALDILNKMDGLYVQNVNAKVENATPVVLLDDIANRVRMAASNEIVEVEPAMLPQGGD